MHVVFFTNQCPDIQITKPKGNSVNAKFYKGNIFNKLSKYFENRRPATVLHGVRLLHNNALEYLKLWKVAELYQPPYSADLASSDFFLLLKINLAHNPRKGFFALYLFTEDIIDSSNHIRKKIHICPGKLEKTVLLIKIDFDLVHRELSSLKVYSVLDRHNFG